MLEQHLARAGTRQVDLEHSADLGTRAVGHHHYAIGQQNGFVHVVGDHHGGEPAAQPHFHQYFLQIPAGQGVKHAKGFVEQQQFGRQRKCAGDTDPLFHAIGQLGSLLVGGLGQPHPFQIVGTDFLALLARGVGVDLFDAERYVVESAQPGQQAGCLEDDTAVRTGVDDLALVERDIALANFCQSRHHRQHGRLAAPRVANQRDELTFVNTEVKTIDHRDRPFAAGEGLGNFRHLHIAVGIFSGQCLHSHAFHMRLVFAAGIGQHGGQCHRGFAVVDGLLQADLHQVLGDVLADAPELG